MPFGALRPIPAGAGEPDLQAPGRSVAGAYPRGRGGTSGFNSTRFWLNGLSPRARGNLADGEDEDEDDGPIPAGAGEPCARGCQGVIVMAYPRGRGGTRAAASRRPGLRGLSPRARGNRHREGDAYRPGGPIPAGAGEPDSSRPPIWRTMAYPRGRGGTDIANRISRLDKGLSPRARGNPAERRESEIRLRPIPAGAGEPQVGTS